MLTLEERSALIQKTLREFIDACGVATTAEGALCMGTLAACAAKSIEENIGTLKAIEMLIAVAEQLAADSPDMAMHVERRQYPKKGHLDA